MGWEILKDLVDDISMAIVFVGLLAIIAMIYMPATVAEKVVIGAITSIGALARGRNSGEKKP